ncbi:MAG: hypothetical protein QNJ34_10320 [Xenococcaceae cyanobacterium MO_188.B29]|nr:hypothetical protein [Xenococcaceae cyanobacterium MO_188.B29]
MRTEKWVFPPLSWWTFPCVFRRRGEAVRWAVQHFRWRGSPA